MKSLRSALVFLAFAGVVFGLLVVAVIFNSDQESDPLSTSILGLAVGWSFIGTGLFAWWRRPSNPTGALMAAAGFTWFLNSLWLANAPGVMIVGIVTSNLSIVILVQLLLSFPSGHLESPAAKAVVIVGYVDAVLLRLVGVLFEPSLSEEMNCQDCGANPIAIFDNHTIFQFLDFFTATVGVLLLVAMVVLLVRRWRGFGSASRAAVTPVLIAGGFAMVCLGVLLVLEMVDASESVTTPINRMALIGFLLVPYSFLFGLLRTRFSNAAAVSELIELLSDAEHNADIRHSLASALGDPTLEIVYWLPESERFVDAAGRPVPSPARATGRCVISVDYDGHMIAEIVYDSRLDEHESLIRATGAAAALALRNQQLDAQLRANVKELHASRARIIQESDAARRELERNLHDGAQQQLVSMALNLRMARKKVDTDPETACELLDQTAADLAAATEELRELARGIHPAILTDRGLGAALDALAGRSPIPVNIAEVSDERLPAPVESAAYFVVSEALTNTARYAEASSAKVRLERVDGVATVEVSDDGIGGADETAGTGLRGLRDRVAAVDGTLEVASPPGAGTVVRARFPCDE